jgi:hypothetical protein
LLATAGSGSVAKRRSSGRVTVQALREEKIVRNRFTSRVGSGGQTAGKAQQAGALFGGRQPSWLSGKALGLRHSEWVTTLGGKERKGHLEREMLFRSAQSEGEPGRSERPKRAKVPSRTKHPGGNKGYGSTGGIKPLKRRSEVVRVSGENAGAERKAGNGLSITGGEKSSGGRSPRASGAERGFHGLGDWMAVERVAKPWVRCF